MKYVETETDRRLHMSEIHVKLTLLDSRNSTCCISDLSMMVAPPNGGSIKILCLAHFESPSKLCILVSARMQNRTFTT